MSVRKVVVYGGGVIVLVAGTAVVTLAVTHNTAVAENLAAYLNGFSDGIRAAGPLVVEVAA